jgi:V/A-type H+-transporting ATPase subunit G/H
MLSETVADEVRAREASAREIVTQAKAEGARLVASARTAGEQAIQEARQKSHRYFRDAVRRAEGEAEVSAVKIVDEGREETMRFYSEKQSRTAEVADWLVKEVMSAYGN